MHVLPDLEFLENKYRDQPVYSVLELIISKFFSSYNHILINEITAEAVLIMCFSLSV